MKDSSKKAKQADSISSERSCKVLEILRNQKNGDFTTYDAVTAFVEEEAGRLIFNGAWPILR